jgi:hypothetical protein
MKIKAQTPHTIPTSLVEVDVTEMIIIIIPQNM